MRNSGPASNNRSTPGGYGGSGSIMPPQSTGYNNPSGGYRGGRGGAYNNRGGGMNNASGYNRPFQQKTGSGFPRSQMGGFQGSPMGGVQAYGGFQNPSGTMNGMRGGAMGMHGGSGSMMGLPMNGMDMGAMGAMGMGMGMGMGMNIPQMGTAMGMQGTRRSLTYLSTTSVGASGSSVSPEARYTSSALQAKKCSPSGLTDSSPPATLLRGGLSPGIAPNLTSIWATYNQYPSPASNPPLARFHSPGAAPVTNFPRAHSDAKLKRKSSSTGPSGFQGYQTHYNPAMFNQKQQEPQTGAAADASWNPHGAKRTRQE